MAQRDKFGRFDAGNIRSITPFPLIGSGAPRTNAMTKAFDPIVLPPASDAPDALRWTCSVCGVVEPLGLPTGRWIKRSCACERAAKEEAKRKEERKKWIAEMQARTFEGWLGKAWEDKAIVAELSAKTFHSFDPTAFPDAYASAISFARNPQVNLSFCGSFGTGKTHLAIAILNFALCVNGITSKFASASQLIKAIEESAKAYDQTRNISLIQQLVETPILLIDDVDKVRPTEARQDFWFLVFDQRYKARRPTIISTNRYDQLEKYIGDAALSRFHRGLVQIEMFGADYREIED